ncbi:hypothetical protein C8J98_102168 [Luteibacter sp. OK325]|uniref:esterase/lipase family protein n=1 Tax=Luteibacter sp. OK325 TaxID=2135670 RepID=UPI000D3776B7|nr:hypothetical protein [Luteibacter sp. OK325]PTR33981.1 hypothetical protein C8J98_102168 [Luteibacter sp. OK325]
MATTLTGSAEAVPLGEGYALRTPGLRGAATLSHATPATTRSRAAVADDGMAALDEALRAQNVTIVKQIDLDIHPAPGTTRTSATRGGEDGEFIELQTPDLGAETGQIVLSMDDAGALRWHLPEDAGDVQPMTTRAGRSVKRFRIPASVISGDAGTASVTSRSILGAAARRVLKVLVYPITDPVLGAISNAFASAWEAKKRPHRLRLFTPENYKLSDVPDLDKAGIKALAEQGPLLLFVHGTFSTAHGGFGDLPQNAMQELHDRYGGRVIALDHPTLSVGPDDNVRWLLSQLPDAPVRLDVICHSRGGLVARVLVEGLGTFALDTSRVNVGRVSFVGAPNNGTALADPDHMVSMIDRITTALTLFPTGPVTETIEAMITVLKMISHGALAGLDGLAGMKPGGTFLTKLNTDFTSTTTCFAVTSNYEPTDSGLRGLVAGLGNGVVDNVFQEARNDLVVPTDGVWDKNGATGFPLAAANLLVLESAEGVMHTTYFSCPAVAQSILKWMG